jgi:hypothetical protein
MDLESLGHEFVEFVPERLDEGVLYVSIEYATAAHKCACGCGNEVFTPLSPTDWSLIFDGDTVSLTPSIGNWSFECQSHYWVERSRIRWAPRWSKEQINQGRELDTLAKERQAAVVAADVRTEPKSLAARLKRLLRFGA